MDQPIMKVIHASQVIEGSDLCKIYVKHLSTDKTHMKAFIYMH